MPEQKKESTNWVKWGLIGLAVIIIITTILALAFTFFIPSWFGTEEKTGAPIPPDTSEVVLRLAMVFGVVIVGLVFVAGIIIVIWEWFFKKKELHIVKEYQKIAKDAALLNPVTTMRNLVLTGQHKVQSYPIGKIVGHTQIPVKFERNIFINESGKVDENLSESFEDFKIRIDEAKALKKDKYDFFAFISQKGLYALPFFNLLEPPKIFACYPSERNPDLVGDIEIYDIGIWKLSGVNLYIPGQRSSEPSTTIKEIESQLMPIAYMSLIDYVGLIAQRGIEGDTSMQKWLQAKSSMVNVKET